MGETVILEYTPASTDRRPREGKFLQLVHGGREVLLFAPREVYRYHNQLLARYLTEHGLPHRWLSQDRLECRVPGLDVVGGGRYRLDEADSVLELWDDSHAYGRFHDAGLAARIAAAGPPWERCRVVIT